MKDIVAVDVKRVDAAVEKLVTALFPRLGEEPLRPVLSRMKKRNKEERFKMFDSIFNIFIDYNFLRSDKLLLMLLHDAFSLETKRHEQLYKKRDARCKLMAHVPGRKKRVLARSNEWHAMRAIQRFLECIADWQKQQSAEQDEWEQENPIYTTTPVDECLQKNDHDLPDLDKQVEKMTQKIRQYNDGRFFHSDLSFLREARLQAKKVVRALKGYKVSKRDLNEISSYLMHEKIVPALLSLLHLYEKHDYHVNDKQLVVLLLKPFDFLLAHLRLKKKLLDSVFNEHDNLYCIMQGWNRVMDWRSAFPKAPARGLTVHLRTLYCC